MKIFKFFKLQQILKYSKIFKCILKVFSIYFEMSKFSTLKQIGTNVSIVLSCTGKTFNNYTEYSTMSTL